MQVPYRWISLSINDRKTISERQGHIREDVSEGRRCAASVKPVAKQRADPREVDDLKEQGLVSVKELWVAFHYPNG